MLSVPGEKAVSAYEPDRTRPKGQQQQRHRQGRQHPRTQALQKGVRVCSVAWANKLSAHAPAGGAAGGAF